MIAEQQTWLVKVTRRVGPVLQVRYYCVVLIEVSLIMNIEQDRQRDDGYGRESGYGKPTRQPRVFVKKQRMDRARPITVDMASNKAYTAASFQQPTEQLSGVAAQTWFQSLVVSSNGRIMPGGGTLPIVEGGNVVGAVAVAGGTDEQDQRYGLARYSKETRRLYGVADRRLAQTEFFAGDMSIADFAILGWAWRHERHQMDLADFPNVKRWYEAMMARPGTRRGFEVALS